MKEQHKVLFEPLKINNLEIKNRYSMAAMGPVSFGANGAYTEDSIEYYVRRAKGGMGLIITGANWCENEVEKHVPGVFATPAYDTEAYIQMASEMTERVHSFGTKMFLQITAGLGRSAIPHWIEGDKDGEFIAPSPTTNRWDPSIQCRELTTEEVEHIVKKMADTAVIAKKCGFDGVEIHAMHEGYLLDCFTMAHFNKRIDKYGGDTRGRMTLPIEILEAIKERCGKDFPVMMRFGLKSFIKKEGQGAVPGEEFVEIGRDTEESLEMARILEEAGYDAFNVDAGSYDAWYWAHPPMYLGNAVYLPFAEKVKDAVNVPVIAAGRMDNPDIGAKAIEEGKLDGVALARPVLADPDIANKVRAGEPETVRPCLSCHDGCATRKIVEHKAMSCAVNPECNRERIVELKPLFKQKNILIVGGGVAGMEAARVSAIRGHKVTLFEATDALGGNVKVAGAPDFKEDDRKLIKWYANELKINNVNVILNKKVTKKEVLNEKPDTVFIATGSIQIKLNIPGADKESVYDASEVLLGKKKVGEEVVIIGGGLVGSELALWLAQEGKKATIVEALGDILSAGAPLAPMNDWALRDLLAFNKVDIEVNSRIVEVTEDGAVIDTEAGRKTIKADNVVFAVGFKKIDSLYNELIYDVNEIYNIGDSKNVNNIRRAIWDAYEIARGL